MKMLVKLLGASVVFSLLLFNKSIAADWPMTFINPDGSEVVIKAPPQRILSTSVSVTGTLLAMEAPVIASATGYNGRFFAQWAKVAEQRKVEMLWPIAEVDIEAAYSVRPDLIVVAVGGRDSAVQHLTMLQKIAPTIQVDYASQSWQQLALKLAKATGLVIQTQQKIAQFNEHVRSVKAQLNLPIGKANIISYNGAGLVNPIATKNGSHGSLLSALGFAIEQPNLAWHGALDKPDDFVKAEYERLTELSAQTTFLLRVDDSGVRRFYDDKVLTNMPSIKAKQVYGLGKNSFRIDYFSAMEIIADMQARFGKVLTK